MNKTSDKYQAYLICLALTVTTIAVYWPVRHFEFINLDDTIYVRDNPYVNSGLSRQAVAWAFTDSISYWHPLTWLSHMLDCQLFGVNPGPHHIVNLFLHIINALLLFTVLWQMTSACWRSAFVAAAFAFHPLRVESVAWVVERKDVLSGLFWMLTIIVYLRYVKKHSSVSYLAALGIFALALMAKPTVITLPFVLLLLDYWPLKRFDVPAPKARQTSHLWLRYLFFQRFIVEKIPFFILSIISVYLSSASAQRLGSTVSIDAVPMSLRIANAIVSYVKYLCMLVWPNNLSPFYPYPHSVPLWQIIGAMSVLLFLLICILRTTKTRPYCFVGGLWFFGTLLPSIGLKQAGLWPAVADRFTYLPSIGVYIAVAWISYDLLKNYKHKGLTLAASAITVLAAFALTSHLQVGYWQNSIKLSEHALKVNDNDCVSHCAMGIALYESGRIDEALTHYYKALGIEPEYLIANANLGIALAKQGKFNEAAPYLNKALQQVSGEPAENNKAFPIEPLNPQAVCAFGVVLGRQGKFNEAVAQFNEALRIKPDFAEAYGDLGYALLNQNKFDEAIKNLTRAVQLDPNSEKAHYYLAIALSGKDRLDEAVKHYNSAIRLKPDLVEPMNTLAWLLATRNDAAFYDPQKAVQLARRACELTADKDAEKLDTLAAAYAAAGNFSDAVAAAEKALSIAKSGENNQLANQIQNRLDLYKAGKSYIEPVQKQTIK